MSNYRMEMNRVLCRLLLPVLFLACAALFAQNNQTVLPADWDKLQELDRLFLESGLAVPFRSRPYSIEELKFYLKRINPSRLSTAGRHSLRTINADLEQRSLYSEEGALAFNTTLILNLESYLHSNSSPELWLYGYEERLPMVSVPLELWLFDTLYAHTTIDIKEGYRITQLNPDNYFNVFSLEYNLVEADWNFPFRAFFALGGEHWLFQLGRDQLNWGNGRTGNLMLSDYADYYDGVRFTTFWRRFKFTTAYIVLQPWLKPGENIIGAGDGPDTDFVGSDGDLYKAFFGHRFEFNFFDRLNISLAESVTFGNKYPELSDFNPFMLYHNWFISERANSLLTLDFELTPAKRLNIYGQVAVDEFKTSKDAGGVPSAMGYLGGVEGFIPLGSGYLDMGAEAVYTDPWFYHDWYPLLQHTTRRRIHTAYHEYGSGQYDWIDKPLGYFTGPDTILQSYYVGYSVSGRFKSMLELRIIHHGRIRIAGDESTASTTFSVDFMEDPNWADLKTPTGTPEIKWIIRLHLSIQPTRSLTLSSDFYSLWIKNYLNTQGDNRRDLQWVGSLSYRF